MNIQGWFPLGLSGWVSFEGQRTPKSLLQHHNLKASILQHSVFFMVQLSYPYMTMHMITGRTIALTIWTFVSNVFNKLSSLVIASLPRSKGLLISWLKSPSTVIFEPKKIKSVTASTFSPSICHEVIGSDTMIFFFFNIEFQASFSTLLFHSYQEAF